MSLRPAMHTKAKPPASHSVLAWPSETLGPASGRTKPTLCCAQFSKNLARTAWRAVLVSHYSKLSTKKRLPVAAETVTT